VGIGSGLLVDQLEQDTQWARELKRAGGRCHDTLTTCATQVGTGQT